jgi:hypothetical protein
VKYGFFDLRQGKTTRVDNPMECQFTGVGEVARTLITFSGATIVQDGEDGHDHKNRETHGVEKRHVGPSDKLSFNGIRSSPPSARWPACPRFLPAA